MRILLSCLSVCLVVSASSVAWAQDPSAFQDPSPFAYDSTSKAGSKNKKMSRLPRLSAKREAAARLIQLRAVQNARQRRARMELRAWQGVSLMRPNLKTLVPIDDRFVPGGWSWEHPTTNLQMDW